MANVDLYLDPICPFSWVASRWLLEAGELMHTPVNLRQMSLAILNEGKDLEGKQRRMMDRSRRLGRLSVAVGAEHGADAFARLYDSIGVRMHVRQDEMTPGEIRGILTENGFGESLSEALDDAGLDQAVEQAHQASQDAFGGSAGSPIIAVDGRGFFGLVLTRIPNKDDGVRLLEAVVAAASVPEFAVLQRPYQGPPILEAGSR